MEDKTTSTARMLLGCIERGSFSIGDDTDHLAKILKQWLLVPDRTERNELDSIYDLLGPAERVLFRSIYSFSYSATFNQINAARNHNASDEATVKLLKQLRKKFVRQRWWFSIHRPSQHIAWKIRAGKEI